MNGVARGDDMCSVAKITRGLGNLTVTVGSSEEI